MASSDHVSNRNCAVVPDLIRGEVEVRQTLKRSNGARDGLCSRCAHAVIPEVQVFKTGTHLAAAQPSQNRTSHSECAGRWEGGYPKSIRKLCCSIRLQPVRSKIEILDRLTGDQHLRKVFCASGAQPVPVEVKALKLCRTSATVRTGHRTASAGAGHLYN